MADINRKKKRLDLFFTLEEFQQGLLVNQSQPSKSGEFQQILECQQKLKLFYGNLSRKQLIGLANKAKKLPGYFTKNFFSLIEQRLDVVLFRSGLAKTLFQSKQYCLHGKVLVNSFVCKSPSTQIKPGDLISLKGNKLSVYNSSILIPGKTKPNNMSKIMDFLSKIEQIDKNQIYSLNKKETSKLLLHLLSEILSLRLSSQNRHIDKNFVAWKKERTLYYKKILLLVLLQDLNLTKKMSFSLKETLNEKNNQLMSHEKGPLNMEISQLTSSLVYLFSPQRIVLPFQVDMDIVRKIPTFTAP